MCKKTSTHVLRKHGEASGTRIVRKSVSPSQCLSRTGLYTNHGPCIDAYGCCGEGELVSGVHTLVAGVVQVYHRLQAVEEEEKGRKVEQEVEREDQSEETARMTMHRLKLEPRCICVCVRMKTRQHYLRKCARRSVDLVAGVRVVKCHASIDVVIDVRVVECHASINVVIGIHFVLCHQVIDFPLF